MSKMTALRNLEFFKRSQPNVAKMHLLILTLQWWNFRYC